MSLSPRQKNTLVTILKLSIVAALLYWMVETGKLSISQMQIFYTNPKIILVGVLIWVTGPVIIGTWRWWLLLKGAGLDCSYPRAALLQMIGFFFNTAMPGAVGGDIVKAIYIVKDQNTPTRKTPAMLSVLLDRIVGMIGLFAMGGVAALMHLNTVTENPTTARLMNGLIVVVALSIIFLAVVFIPYKNGRDPIEKIFRMNLPGFKTLHGIYGALRAYKDRPGILLGTIGLSILLQLMFMWYMGFVGTQIYPDSFRPELLPTVFPFGILVTAVPLAPGGLGVGHAAFEKLFALVGLPGGANVFNVYTLTQLSLNLLCFIPYLASKRPISEADLSQVTSA